LLQDTFSERLSISMANRSLLMSWPGEMSNSSVGIVPVFRNCLIGIRGCNPNSMMCSSHIWQIVCSRLPRKSALD